MATLAAFFKRSDAAARSAAGESRIQTQDPFVLRALPNESIFLYLKQIDNSRVVRQADPGARGECWNAMGAAALVLALGTSVIAPTVATVMKGYELESLKHRKQELLDQKRELEVREAGLRGVGRLHELAAVQELHSPAADQIVHLDNHNFDGAFAKNTLPAR